VHGSARQGHTNATHPARIDIEGFIRMTIQAALPFGYFKSVYVANPPSFFGGAASRTEIRMGGRQSPRGATRQGAAPRAGAESLA